MTDDNFKEDTIMYPDLNMNDEAIKAEIERKRSYIRKIINQD